MSSFPSSATVSYNLGAQLFQTGEPGKSFGDSNQLSTSNPYTDPVRLNANISDTIGDAAGTASAFANATLTASAGLLRAGIDGTATASWTAGQTSEARLASSFARFCPLRARSLCSA